VTVEDDLLSRRPGNVDTTHRLRRFNRSADRLPTGRSPILRPATSLSDAHRIAHGAESTLTHAVPKLSTALMPAYPPAPTPLSDKRSGGPSRTGASTRCPPTGSPTPSTPRCTPIRPGRVNLARVCFLNPHATTLHPHWDEAANTRRHAAHRSRPKPLRPRAIRPRRRTVHPQRHLPQSLGHTQRAPAPNGRQAVPSPVGWSSVSQPSPARRPPPAGRP
jgi:hypothetical protein